MFSGAEVVKAEEREALVSPIMRTRVPPPLEEAGKCPVSDGKWVVG